MHAAFILIITKKGKAWNVARDVAKVDGVKFAHVVTGPYDVVAYVETVKPILEELRRVIEGIFAIEGVERTLTCIVVH